MIEYLHPDMIALEIRGDDVTSVRNFAIASMNEKHRYEKEKKIG
jgi:hypothetical protein